MLAVKNLLSVAENVPQNKTKSHHQVKSDTAGIDQFGFNNERDAFDSLVNWVIHPKVKPAFGFLSEAEFLKQLRMVDTVTPVVMARAQHIHYEHKMVKSIEKFRKYCKSNSMILKKMDSASGLPVIVKWPPIVYLNKGPYSIKRYEIEITKKKQKFILQFELWWIDGKGYWSNELRYYNNTD